MAKVPDRRAKNSGASHICNVLLRQAAFIERLAKMTMSNESVGFYIFPSPFPER